MLKQTLDQNTWESKWAPYDEPTYQQVLSFISPEDIVIDIGAGDLRLSRRIAKRCQQVIALEVQFDVIKAGIEFSTNHLPRNLYAVCADARKIPFPTNISTGVLLMRHCSYFQLYAEKLKKSGAKRLITNARWRLGVEIIDLKGSRERYEDVLVGEYACWCGSTGFINGPVEKYKQSDIGQVNEVIACPECNSNNYEGMA